MHIVRTFFYLLLACNLVLASLNSLSLFGLEVPWQTNGESERLKRQLSADKIILLKNPEPGTAPPQAPVAAQSSPEAGQSSATPGTPMCVVLRNLTSDEVAQVTAQAAPLGGTVTQYGGSTQGASYWVNIPPGGGKEGASRRAEALTKAGITDYIIVREAGPNQFAISLGLFRNEEAAKRLVDQLQKKSVKSVRITVRDNSGASRIELRGPTGPLTPLLDEIQTRFKAVQRDDCAPG